MVSKSDPKFDDGHLLPSKSIYACRVGSCGPSLRVFFQHLSTTEGEFFPIVVDK